MKRTFVEYHYSVTMANGEEFNIVTNKSIGVRKINKMCKDKGSEYKSVICTTELYVYEMSDDKFLELATRLD